jgi:hypothetical protein
MADLTYNAKVYEKQGAAEYVVADGGTLTVEDGGKVVYPVVTETTGVALDGFGLSICGSTKVKKNYKLGAPAAGVQKVIEFTVTSATGYVHAGSTSYVIEDSKSNGKYLKATKNGTALLFGASATKYLLVSMSTSVSHTTSST